MKRAGRDFEKLVTRIERALCPAGAVVRSPDRIPDVNTGKLREVDASIRYQIGSSPILIAVECRERVKAEDVTWLEQLSSKRDNIGATLMVAVSSKGFSQEAVIAARRMRIEVRTVRDISEADIASWARQLRIEYRHEVWDIKQLHYMFERHELQDIELSREVVDPMLACRLDGPVLFSVKSRQPVIAQSLIHRGFRLPHPEALTGERDRLIVIFNFEDERPGYYVPTNHGELVVRSLHIHVESSFKTGNAALNAVFDYHDGKQSVAQFAESVLPLDDQHVLIVSATKRMGN